MDGEHPKDRPTCTPGSGCCAPLARREFLQLVSAGLATAAIPLRPIMAGPFDASEFDKLVPADKKLDPAWVRSLTERGEPAVYSGRDLGFIGMPVGGICAGQLYLGGDGRLWHWDIFNLTQNSGSHGPRYAEPLRPDSPLEQGFAVRVTQGTQSQVRALDARGFSDIRFRGQYPIGFVDYHDPACPVSVHLEACSPFIPLSTDDSSLPATILQFTLRNRTADETRVDFAGWMENAVCARSGEAAAGVRVNRAIRSGHALAVACTAEPRERQEALRPPVLFASFDEGTYGAWTVEGTAFGTRPATGKGASEQNLTGQVGSGLVNSYAASDVPRGRLVSPEFTIERPFIRFLIAGGNHPGKTCINLLVDGRVVRSQTGQNSDALKPADWNVRALIGKTAHIEIVDDHEGGWGHIDIDQIEFADTPHATVGPLPEQADFGSMCLALLHPGEADQVTAALPEGDCPACLFDRDVEVVAHAEQDLPARPRGAVLRELTLPGGGAATITCVIAWHFPNLRLDGFKEMVGRHYATRFASAHAIVEHVAENFKRLTTATRLWHDTWYASTLPYWFLDRTFTNASTLATSTSHRFASGRFYGWEGVGCCAGTCTHVWHYAQAVGRLFPELERSAREMADFGVSYDPTTGLIHFRGEFRSGPAVDGQAGCILRAYREHQMSADDTFLRRNWERIRGATQYLIDQDMDADGLLESRQHNTLDTEWYGPVAWLSSLYIAALRAAEEMAREVGDTEFAHMVRPIAERGSRRLIEVLWNGEYFIHQPDPNYPEAMRSADGCEIDQVFGQSWAWQLGLGRIIEAKHARGALQSLWKYNFAPDVGPFRKAYPPGRWYAMAGEAGLIMCTFPRGGAKDAAGKTPFAAYFNECMSGFEYQVAGHMIWEGLITEGLAVARAIHDRYHPSRRNPWNEIECGDHYARAMASYGVYLAACGCEYHGPRGHLGFAPRLTPEKFRCAFTAAEGWGTYEQERVDGRQSALIDLEWGQLRLKTLAFEAPAETAPTVRLSVGGREVASKSSRTAGRIMVELEQNLLLNAGDRLQVVIG